MGGFAPQIQSNQTSGQPSGKGGPPSQPPQGANGTITTPATSAQPSMGAPNQYSNTTGQWDNQPQWQNPQQLYQPQQNSFGGKGKG